MGEKPLYSKLNAILDADKFLFNEDGCSYWLNMASLSIYRIGPYDWSFLTLNEFKLKYSECMPGAQKERKNYFKSYKKAAKLAQKYIALI